MRGIPVVKVDGEQAAHHRRTIVLGEWTCDRDPIGYRSQIFLVLGPDPRTQRMTIRLVHQCKDENHVNPLNS